MKPFVAKPTIFDNQHYVYVLRLGWFSLSGDVFNKAQCQLAEIMLLHDITIQRGVAP